MGPGFRRDDSSLHVLARIVRLLLLPLAHQLVEFGVAALRQHDAHRRVEVAAPALLWKSLALETERAPGASAGRDRELHRAVERRDAHLAAEHRLVERD